MPLVQQIAVAGECIAGLHGKLGRQAGQQIQRLRECASDSADAFNHRSTVVSHHQCNSHEQVDQQAQRTCTCFAEQPRGRSIADQLSKPRRRIDDRFPASATGLPCRNGGLLGREEIVPVHVDQLKCTAAATGNTGQRIIGHVHVQAGLVRNQLVQIPQQRATAG